MQKGENFNHPSKGTEIRVAPIKRSKDIEAVKRSLSDHPRNLALFTLGINTSLRPGELLNIRIDEIIGMEPMDTLEVKGTRTTKVRKVTLNHACIDSVRNLIRAQKERGGKTPSPTDLLFKSPRGPLSVPTLNNLVKKWCSGIGLTGNYGGHSLRKTYAFHQLFRYGLSIEELMSQLNHRKRQQTFDYLCLRPEDLKRLEQKNGSKGNSPISRALKKKAGYHERNRADLGDSEEIYRVLFENANDGIVLIDTEAKVLEVNEANGRIFGWTREEVLGKSIFELGLIPPENETLYFGDTRPSVVDQASPGVWENEVIRKDGSRAFIEVNVNLVKEREKPTGLLSIIRDVTDRKHMEQQLQESEEMKRALLNATTDAVMLLNLEGHILDINAAYADKFGRQADEIIGLCLWDLIPSDVRNIKENIDRVIATNESIRFEEEYRKVWADNIVHPVSDMNGNVSRVAIFSHDITTRKQAEETLRRHRDHLEELVKERTVNLEQTNTALKVLLKRRDEDKIELEERMVLNVKELVLPFMEELKNSRLNDEQKALAEVVEYNLNDIVSPFVKALSSKYYNLTPAEIQIANLIKQGKSSKELAGQLKMSPRTIDIHRYHIRKKLGINNKKTNLRTHLLSIN